eukprot:2978757-Amphidinium_carterae.4
MQLQQQPQVDVAAALANLPQALAGAVQAVVSAGPARPIERKTLIHIKGLGRPQQVHHPETEFVICVRRAENFKASVLTGAKDVLTWAVELDPSSAANAAELTLAEQLYTFRSRSRRRLRSLAALTPSLGPTHHTQGPRTS